MEDLKNAQNNILKQTQRIYKVCLTNFKFFRKFPSTKKWLISWPVIILRSTSDKRTMKIIVILKRWLHLIRLCLIKTRTGKRILFRLREKLARKLGVKNKWRSRLISILNKIITKEEEIPNNNNRLFGKPHNYRNK